MIDLDEILRKLSGDAEAIRALMQTVSPDQARWKPDPKTWSMKEVMEHVYNEERIDFRMHLKEMLTEPQQPWGALQQEGYLTVESCQQALEKFLSEREASISWLKSLPEQNWETSMTVEFSPSESRTLTAGDVLLSWVNHDYLHMRQMIELLHAWAEKQAVPYSLEYAGGW